MRKVLTLTFVFALIGNSSAFAQDLPSGDSDAPPAARAADQAAVTSSVGIDHRQGRVAGFSAARGFGPSDQNNLPAPRFQAGR
ncbi:hypothetical protein [Nitratireductor thuwali]|uniref:Uncharacterized protein n=1 Tax=Nitratireductor thuwali TaxID=2267699 RepID=A0ABY5MLT9_9HYPH|nr:hypothetical protein NTH_02279 [Nitratireductor thuwali]